MSDMAIPIIRTSSSAKADDPVIPAFDLGYWMPAFAGMTLRRMRTEPYAAAGNEAFAFSTIAWKATGSVMARSDSTLRSTIRPDLFSPSINRL